MNDEMDRMEEMVQAMEGENGGHNNFAREVRFEDEVNSGSSNSNHEDEDESPPPPPPPPPQPQLIERQEELEIEEHGMNTV